MSRILVAVAASVGALAILGAHPVQADPGAPPVVTQWSPQTVSQNGQPVRITIVGSNLAGVDQVFTTPVLAQRSVAVISDQAVVVTLPADMQPGAYALQLVSPDGSTPPGAITLTVLQGRASRASSAATAKRRPRRCAAGAVRVAPRPRSGCARPRQW